MSDHSLFVAAVSQWVRDHPDLVIQHLDDALRNNPNYANRNIEYRTDHVTDYRGQLVPASAERLVHWTDVEPNTVFEEGLVPQEQEDMLFVPRRALDVGAYVDDSSAARTVFVSTARYYRTPGPGPSGGHGTPGPGPSGGHGTPGPVPSGGHGTRWQPRRRANRYEYEIYAHGGIDVNLSLGSRHSYWHQREIAFAGGIRPAFIRSAREYDANGHLVRIWVNDEFDSTVNGVDHRPNLVQLPPLVCRGVPIRHWPDPGQPRPPPPLPGHDEMRRRRSTSQTYGNVMREDGEPADDDLLVGDCEVYPKRAVFSVPDEPSQAYFFAFNQSVRIRFTPGKVDDTIMDGPKTIINGWPSLRRAGFSRVDAVVPSPNGGGETYFFSGTQYALVKVVPGTTNDHVINGPKSIATEWPSLRRAGFDTVDAAFPSPNNKKEIYFFSGTEYALIKVEPGTHDDELINGPKAIATEWPSLRKAGFNTVDAALPSPDGDGKTYFFSGSQYALIKVKPGKTDDKLINGPKSVATEWPSLHQAGFY